LYCSTSISCLLVESTSFFSCKTSGGGAGALFFENTNNGQCILYKVCGYDCCTTDSNYPHFIQTNVKNDILSKNYFNYSSISRCVNENAWTTLYLINGIILCPSVNISNNKNRGNSALCCPSSYSNTVTCSVSYSSIADNIASDNTCLILCTTGAEHEVKSCNILRNTQSSLNVYGTIATQGNLKIMDSCILENKANNIFFQRYSSYRITLLNCTVDSTSNNGYLIIENIVTKSFILALNHMSTQNCHSGYDAAEYLTPIIQTLSSSKVQKYWCTCQKYRLKLRDEDVVSLISILIFNFIHLDA
jgi:hypothetical protein